MVPAASCRACRWAAAAWHGGHHSEAPTLPGAFRNGRGCVRPVSREQPHAAFQRWGQRLRSELFQLGNWAGKAPAFGTCGYPWAGAGRGPRLSRPHTWLANAGRSGVFRLSR
jgi:hypothetical protein